MLDSHRKRYFDYSSNLLIKILIKGRKKSKILHVQVMRNNEFNKIEITNEKEVSRAEFGKTQKLEFTSQKDNKVPEGELNEKYVGKTIRKQTEVNVQYANKATAPAHGSTTVTSSTTATNIAATTATVATAASVVAVAAVAVGTGISIALHDYKYKFNQFDVTSNSLTYELYITDLKKQRVDGKEYQTYEGSSAAPTTSVNGAASSAAPLASSSSSSSSVSSAVTSNVASSDSNSSTNYGNLTTMPSSTYTSNVTSNNPVSSSEAKNINEKEEDKPFVLRVYNSDYDYSVPADLDINTGTFTNLKPKEKYHIVLTENRFGGETIFDESFTTLEEDKRVSVFKGVEFDGTCNFLTNVATVRLDFVDDFNRFSDFQFTLKSEMVTATGSNEITYNLKKTTEKQEIKLDSDQRFNLAMTYDYSFTYVDVDLEVTAKTGTVHFEDNSGAKSEFRNFVFDMKANFMNRTFDVQLDYVDDFNVYDNFVLTFYYQDQTGEGRGYGVEIPLRKTTAVQTVDLDGYEVMLNETYQYELTCDYYGEKTTLRQGVATFTDNSGAVNEFYSLTFDKKANFDTRTFEVQLDYKNDLGYLYGFQFILTDLVTLEERTYYLIETTDVQEITVDEIKEYDNDNEPVYYIDIVQHRMKYTFKYETLEEEHIVVKDEEFKFKNSLVSTFQGIDTPYDFVYEAAYGEYLLPMKFNYNDAAHIYSEFEIRLYKDDELYGRLMIENERSLDKWFYAIFAGMEGHVLEDIASGDIDIKITTLVPSETSQDLEELEVYTETARFKIMETHEYYDIDFDDGDQPGSIVGDSVTFTPIFTGDFGTFYDTYLVFECQSGHVYTMYFNTTIANQMVTETFRGCQEFEDYEEDFYNDFEQPVKITLHYDTTHQEYVGDNNGSGPTYETVPDNNPRTLLISENYKFTISV